MPALADAPKEGANILILSGSELAGKALEVRPGQPIILCTGQSGLINRAKAMEMGIYDYLEKPVTNYPLMVAMRKALVKNQQRLYGIPMGCNIW